MSEGESGCEGIERHRDRERRVIEGVFDWMEGVRGFAEDG